MYAVSPNRRPRAGQPIRYTREDRQEQQQHSHADAGLLVPNAAGLRRAAHAGREAEAIAVARLRRAQQLTFASSNKRKPGDAQYRSARTPFSIHEHLRAPLEERLWIGHL